MTAKYGFTYDELQNMDEDIFDLYLAWLRIDDIRQEKQAITTSNISGKDATRAVRELSVRISRLMHNLGMEQATGISHGGGPRRQHKRSSRKEVIAETKKLQKKKAKEKQNGN